MLIDLWRFPYTGGAIDYRLAGSTWLNMSKFKALTVMLTYDRFHPGVGCCWSVCASASSSRSDRPGPGGSGLLPVTPFAAVPI
jgi:hypothetical protein